MAYNFGQGAQGAMQGAAAGFGIGGPWGAAGGGILGLLSGFGGAKGQKGGFEQLQNMSPEQQQLLEQIMQMLGPEGQLGQGNEQAMQYLMQLLNPDSAAQQRFAQPYMNQFNQQTVPGLAERFAGAGAQGGALSSSGFGQALGSAGSDLQTKLAGLKSQLQHGASQDIMNQYRGMTGQGLGASPFTNVYKNPTGGYATGQF